MSDDIQPMDPPRAWTPYAPDDNAPWDLQRVGHLHRRVGFAATWAELQRDLKDGPKVSVDRLLQGKARGDGVPEGFDETANLLAEAAVSSRDAGRLKAWWVYRMLFGPDPLTERLALLWHNHFATGIDKVRDVAVMRRQNELFRKHGRGKFGDLLSAVVCDPALLMYLDAQLNRKGHANENLAREMMELFTLGIGHYSEKDVKEAARALTGWVVEGDAFRFDAARHDEGAKTILGKTGEWKGDDFVRILLGEAATAKRLAFRLCELFMGENAVDDRAKDELANGLRVHKLDIGWGVETILRSRAFFAEVNLRSRVLGPIEFAIGVARMLEPFAETPGTLLLADWAARLGQDLFSPPNVGGWPGGRHWLSTQAMIGRANFAAALVEGRLSRSGRGVDCLGLAVRHGHGKDLRSVLTFYGQLTLGAVPSPDWHDRLTGSLGPSPSATPECARRAVVLILASPAAQLM